MLDKALLREQPDLVRRNLQRRQIPIDAVDEFLGLDARWRTLVTELDAAKAERNRLSAQFAKAKTEGSEALARLRAQAAAQGERIKEQEHEAGALDRQLRELLAQIPNVLADDVPDGADTSANAEVRRWGEPRKYAFEPKPHWEVGERLGILDFERAARMAQSRFVVLLGAGARLNRALIDFFLERNLAAGFKEIMPPLLLNRDTVEATGHLSKFSDAMYVVGDGSLYLSPTSEVQLVNMHRDEIMERDELPKRYTAYTPCFRQEAGAAGKDTRGMIRHHQFEKVELVGICAPEESAGLHEEIVRQAESLLQALEIPYRVVVLCSGDTGFASRKTYDIEVWLPSQNEYREISSCSNCGDFQARRAMIRYRPLPGARPEFVHTLNGSGLAVGRAIIGILENYQQEDGSVAVPQILRSYMNGLVVIN